MENSEFKPDVLHLKIDLVSYPARTGGVGIDTHYLLVEKEVFVVEFAVGACSEWKWFLVRILRVLHSHLVPPQIQHKFYKHVKQMEYDNNEH